VGTLGEPVGAGWRGREEEQAPGDGLGLGTETDGRAGGGAGLVAVARWVCCCCLRWVAGAVFVCEELMPGLCPGSAPLCVRRTCL